MTIEEFFGTLLQSVTEAHKKHLMTGKYSDHIALNEFYDEMPDLVDDLIEHWQGENGKVENYKNVIDADDAVEYLESLLKFVKQGKKELFDDDSAIISDIDDIIGQIDSTLYKLKELKEGYISLGQYVNEMFGMFGDNSKMFKNRDKQYKKYNEKCLELFEDIVNNYFQPKNKVRYLLYIINENLKHIADSDRDIDEGYNLKQVLKDLEVSRRKNNLF